MSARIPPGFAEAWFQYNVIGDLEPMYFAVGCEVSAPPTIAQVNTMMGNCYAALDNIASSAYTLGPGHVIVGQDGGDIRLDCTITPIPGTSAGDAVPQNTCILVRKVTAGGGRRNRGRCFVPAVNEAAVDNAGRLAGSFRTAVDAAFAALITGLATAPFGDPVLFHESEPFTPTPLVEFSCQQLVATQRRRLRR